MPKISIIIPLYNKALYVEHCLQTVASQSFTDWECIIVNDGSTDNSAHLVESWLAQNPQSAPHYTQYTQKNAGVAAARNYGVAQSSGEYITFLDADDWWKPSFLEKMVRFAEQNPEAGLWTCNYIIYKTGNIRTGVRDVVYQSKGSNVINYPKSYYLGYGMPVWTGAVMMRRSVFDEMGGFPVGIRLGEDFLLWSKIALRYSMAFLDEPLAYYNNDVPAYLRATRNLHAPEHHMLWHLDDIEAFLSNVDESYVQRQDWLLLLDKLRANGLMDYWLDDRYHDAAAEQLKKVDWSLQPKSVVKFYHSPLWILRCKQWIRRVGSYSKQKLIKMLQFK